MSADFNANFNFSTCGISDSKLDGYRRTTKPKINSLTLPNYRNGLTVFQIPPQRQAPNVSCDFMTYTQFTIDWNADPNSPDAELVIDGTSVILHFCLNYFIYDNFNEGDKAKITFLNCHKYCFNSMNDEGYFMGQYRYKYTDLPWGEFYKLNTDWETDFPLGQIILNETVDKRKLNHYIFFFKDNTFECVAENYQFEFNYYNDK